MSQTTQDNPIERFKDDYGADNAVDLEAKGLAGKVLEDAYIDGSNVVYLADSQIQRIGMIDITAMSDSCSVVDRITKDGTELLVLESANSTHHIAVEYVEMLADIFNLDSEQITENLKTDDSKGSFFPVRYDHDGYTALIAPYNV